MSKMIRISEPTSSLLDNLVVDTNLSKQRLLEEAVELLSRKYFLKKTNAEYAMLRKNGLLEDLERELSDWNVTLLDGLKDEQ